MNNDLKPCPKCNVRPVQESRVEVLGGIQDGRFAVILRRYKCPVCGDAPGWRRYHYADSGWDRNIEVWNEYVEGKKQTMNNDLIRRSLLLTVPNVRKVTEYDEGGWGMSYNAVPEEAIEKAPAVDAEPVRHGRWEVDMVTNYKAYPAYTYKSGYKCSLCGRRERTNKEPYCHCGAKMDGGEQNV